MTAGGEVSNAAISPLTATVVKKDLWTPEEAVELFNLGPSTREFLAKYQQWQDSGPGLNYDYLRDTHQIETRLGPSEKFDRAVSGMEQFTAFVKSGELHRKMRAALQARILGMQNGASASILSSGDVILGLNNYEAKGHRDVSVLPKAVANGEVEPLPEWQTPKFHVGEHLARLTDCIGFNGRSKSFVFSVSGKSGARYALDAGTPFTPRMFLNMDRIWDATQAQDGPS
jgi:hypothetical protein